MVTLARMNMNAVHSLNDGCRPLGPSNLVSFWGRVSTTNFPKDTHGHNSSSGEVKVVYKRLTTLPATVRIARYPSKRRLSPKALELKVEKRE